jgi:class 3 adenylate cyclase
MFSFKYKLTLLISLIILPLLSGTFLIIQNILEDKFIQSIDEDLKETHETVQKLMQIRKSNLQSQAKILQSNKLIREILNDRTLDRLTTDDLLDSEILPNYKDIHALIVSSADGKTIAASDLGNKILSPLHQADFFKYVLSGQDADGYLFYKNHCLQMLSVPIFLREEMIGILSIAIILAGNDIKTINKMTGAELTFFNQNKIFLSTQWLRSKKKRIILLKDLQAQVQNNSKLLQPISLFDSPLNNNSTNGDIPARTPQRITLDNELFIFLPVINNQEHFLPPYIIAKSLDKQLLFVKQLRIETLYIAIAGILLGFLFSWFFSKNISKPIHILQQGTKKIENQQYHHRVEIHSHDEFSLLAKSFNKMSDGLQEREKIRSAMNKVVSKKIADEMLKGEIVLGGEEKIATILFSDIRQFTALSEGFSPPELLNFLNDFFTQTSHCIDSHMGVVDKYIGDAVMVLFGVPISREDSAWQSVLAACDMLKALEEFNINTAKPLGKNISIGIGINTGSMVAGNIGAIDRLNYTVLGDSVNLASRLEGLCKLYKTNLIISESTYQAIESIQPTEFKQLTFRQLDRVQVKGKSESVLIYEVIPIASKLLINSLTDYNQAKTYLFEKNFIASLQLFQQLHQQYPDDGPVSVFYLRLQVYVNSPDNFEQEYSNSVYCCSEK